MNAKELAEKAVYIKNNEHKNCAQSVAAALSGETDLSAETLLQLTSGFGGGMATLEATCGALVGAGMIAGLKTGGNGTRNYSRAILKDFKERCGAVTCSDLKGVGTGKVLCSCDDCVRNAVYAYCRAFDIE
ncbi:MAG: C_GCAxxG_C_C family protein [Lachnospiraceae bacterium]|nr:C_GCAxxG_C_C family protein [Lachnospiraceae bacterium]